MLVESLLWGLSCLLFSSPCQQADAATAPQVAGVTSEVPVRSPEALDVVTTAEAVIAWDIASGTTLYEKSAHATRPVASLNKLLTALVAREELALGSYVPVSEQARRASRFGANIKLPVGHHALAEELFEATLVASANDAAVVLAEAISGTEARFALHATQKASSFGATSTVVSNATGFSGGIQHSTASDVRALLTSAYNDPILRKALAMPRGVLTTREGARLPYASTNKLLPTYVTVLAGKTGYTTEAKQNLAIIAQGPEGQKVGAVVLGSDQRFQDMKVLLDWIWRSYEWSASAPRVLPP